jgi:hypothetical protein
LVEDAGGAVGVADLAEALDVEPSYVRAFAQEQGVAVVGTAYAFDVAHATLLAAEVEALDDEEDEQDQLDEEDEQDQLDEEDEQDQLDDEEDEQDQLDDEEDQLDEDDEED